MFDAEPVRRLGLAKAGNIVVLALDREQRDAADAGRIDRRAPMGHGAVRQIVAHEHGLDRLQIVLRAQIHHRKIFIVELTVFLGGIAIALDQMGEQVAVRLDVALEIHADEAVELQESRIDVAHQSRIWKRHLGDDVAAEPVGAGAARRARSLWSD